MSLGYDPKLKEAAAEIKALCRKHNIAAYVALVSESHAEYVLEITPTWSAAHWEDRDNGKLRFRVKQAEVGKEKAKDLIEVTCHMVYQIRDLCAQGFAFAQNMTKLIEEQVDVEHEAFKNHTPHREG